MQGDTFDYKGKTFSLKKDISFGEFKKQTKLQLDIKNATPDNEQELSVKFNDTMTEFLKDMLGVDEEYIDSLGLLGAAELFGVTFLNSTQVKKKLEITSDSPSN